MRVTCDLLNPLQEAIALHAAVPVAPLWSRRLQWTCRGRSLDCQVVFAEPMALPEPEPSEPVEGALARLGKVLHGTGALLLLRNPSEAFGLERMPFADGVRLLGIGSEADEACWDAALTLARPVYGVRGLISCEVLRPHPASVLSALAYGVYVCEEGLTLTELHEDRRGVRWACTRDDAVASVVIRDGYEAASLSGSQGQWRDLGSEGYVRVVVRAGAQACWTQPRFVAPSGAPPIPPAPPSSSSSSSPSAPMSPSAPASPGSPPA